MTRRFSPLSFTAPKGLAHLSTRLSTKLGLVLPRDPRVFQIIALSSLLVFGWTSRAFDISFASLGAIMAGAIGAQWLGSALNAVKFEVKSPLITGLSLTLLLRADSAAVLGLVAAFAIALKFAVRWQGKHLFNPANGGIVAALLFSALFVPGLAWTTPGQWGAAMWLAAVLAGAGFFVSYRAARLDVPLVFLATFAVLLIGRALWLGDPLAIPLLRLQNGALILFAFFMISDPKTTPDGPWPRVIFAAMTALLAYLLTFNYFISDGIFYALAAMCLIRPLIESLQPGPAYEWSNPRNANTAPALVPADKHPETKGIAPAE